MTQSLSQLIPTVINVVLAIGSFLLIRWLGGLVKSLEQKIEIATLKLAAEAAKTYATKPELEQVRADLRREVDLADRVDSGFERLGRLVIARTAKVGESSTIAG